MGELIQFPKVVKINSLTNEGVFTLTVENIKEVVPESSLFASRMSF